MERVPGNNSIKNVSKRVRESEAQDEQQSDLGLKLNETLAD